jgi:4-amino-4-deoxy-L-arabinose transferase-like glycosyltransferase
MIKKPLLFAILLIAFLLRFINLSSYPALNADEASLGYDAYSLLTTGRDQHGNPWPVSFQSFNDFKPGLYVYLILPFVKTFGLNELSVRVPGAFLGIATVFLIYKLALLINKNERFALFAAFLLAVSPWHVHYSRGAWEVNIATFLTVLGSLLLLRSFEEVKNKRIFIYAVLSALAFVLSFYAYHASRVIAPLLLVSFAIVYRINLIKNSKAYLSATIIAALALIPLVLNLLAPGALYRAAGVGLTADKGPVARINEQRGEHSDLGGIATKLLHNKAVNYGLVFLNNWTSHYNGEFLFMSGDSIERNKVPETGQLYLFEIVFLLAGLIAVSRNLSKNWTMVLAWLVIAPVASALTFQSPNALRSQNMIIPLILLSALGLNEIITWLKIHKLQSGVFVLLTIMIWNIARYQEMYWIHMSKIYPFSSQYGVKELVDYLNRNADEYKKVVVTTRYDQPYILFLFYSKYPPREFQNKHTLTSRDEYGFSTVAEFDKYSFEPINFQDSREIYPDSLIAGTKEEIPQSSNIIKRIYGTNGYEYFNIVSN